MENSPPIVTERFDAFRFNDSSELLRGYVDYRRSTSRYFSISAWAKKLELPTSGILVNFLKRRRLPPEDLASRLSESMQLTSGESEYFATLVALERAQKSHSISVGPLERRLAALNLRARSQLLDTREIERLTLRKTALKDMMKLPGASTEPEWIHENSRLDLSPEEIRQTIAALIAEGSLQASADGRWGPATIPVETSTDVPSSAIRDFHRESLAYAAESLERVPVDERHFMSYVMAIESSRMQEAKDAIQEFYDEFVARFEAPIGRSDAVYQFNLSYVPLTRRTSEKGSA